MLLDTMATLTATTCGHCFPPRNLSRKIRAANLPPAREATHGPDADLVFAHEYIVLQYRKEPVFGQVHQRVHLLTCSLLEMQYAYK